METKDIRCSKVVMTYVKRRRCRVVVEVKTEGTRGK